MPLAEETHILLNHLAASAAAQAGRPVNEDQLTAHAQKVARALRAGHAELTRAAAPAGTAALEETIISPP